MPDWKQEIRRRLAKLKLDPTRESAIVEELTQHLEDSYIELLAGGATAAEAERRTKAELSEPELFARDLKRVERQARPKSIVPRPVQRNNMIADLWQDLRYGARMLIKSPGFTSIVILTLATGIGANTAVFSVVNAILLQSLPYKEADRLVVVSESWPARNLPHIGVDPDTFADWQEQNQVFSDMAAFVNGEVTLTGDSEPEKVASQSVTPNLFALLGAGVMLGRTFIPDDIKPGQSRFVLISHGLWHRRFGGDPSVIGRKLKITLAVPEEATIIGIMPADFRWRVTIGKPAELWTPFMGLHALTKGHGVWQGRWLTAVARLKPGVSLAQAQVEMATIAARVAKQYPNYHAELSATVTPLRERLYGDLRPALLVLFGAVAFVLLIACANVANLQLARAAGRGKEIALRAALGACRFRILRQLLTESLLLAVLGGSAGLLLANWGTDLLVSLSPRYLLGLQSVQINAPVLIFTLAISLATSFFIGLAPAYELSRLDLHEGLKESGPGVANSRNNKRLRGLFVIGEIALALALLVGAGLLMNSFAHLQAVDPGFNPQNLLTMGVSRNWQHTEGQRIEFFKQAVERLQSIPGVTAAGAISALPLTGSAGGVRFFIEGRPKPLPGQDLLTRVLVTDANYFRTMQIPLRHGRLYTEQETTEARGLALINEALARRYFPNEDPVGKQVTIHSRPPGRNPPVEIIGIVGDVKLDSLDRAVEPTVYWPHSELALPGMTLVSRTSGDPSNVAAAAQAAIHSLDPEQPITDLSTMEGWLGSSMGRARFNLVLLTVFASVALILASVGIYGVMAYAVAQRTQEIGIRMALGAQARDVLKIVMIEGMTLALIGIAIGLLAAFVMTRWMETMLFGVPPADPLTYTVIAAVLTLVTLIACWIPARRATKVDPLIALRCE